MCFPGRSICGYIYIYVVLTLNPKKFQSPIDLITTSKMENSNFLYILCLCGVKALLERRCGWSLCPEHRNHVGKTSAKAPLGGLKWAAENKSLVFLNKE